MRRGREIAVAIWTCLLAFVDVEAKHYRGGTINWSPVEDNPEQVKITYHLAFKLRHVEPGHEDCLLNSKEEGELLQTNGYLKCDECDNGQNKKIHDLEYVCKSYDEIGEWAVGVNSFIYDAPSTQFNISYENCCWVDLVSHERGTGLGWKMAASIDLRRRPDTGRINSSPIAESLPVQFMDKGCSYALSIPAIDPDNDDVRCRWPDMEHECNQVNNGVCGPTPRARLRTKDCTIRFDTRRMQVGWHAVNLIVEDFANETSDVPLSKVSLQFLIYVQDSVGCTKPKVVSPEVGSCRTIPANTPLEAPLIVSVAPGRSVRSFTTLKPEGMIASEVRPLPGKPTDFYSLLTWTPTTEQIGKHIVCFQATDNYNSPSTMMCMNLNVMDAESIGTLTIEEIPPASVVNPGRLRFQFNEEIARPKKSKFITILDSSGIEVYNLDVSKRSSDVTFEGRILEFGLPSDVFENVDSDYRLLFDAGVVNSKTMCGVESVPYEWPLQYVGNFSRPRVTPTPSGPPGADSGNIPPTGLLRLKPLPNNGPPAPRENATPTPDAITTPKSDSTTQSSEVSTESLDITTKSSDITTHVTTKQPTPTLPPIIPSSSVVPAGSRRPPNKIEMPPTGVPPCDPAAVPECLYSSMTIYVSKAIVGDIDPYRLHLIDPSCRGEPHNATHYVIGTGYGMCGTTFLSLNIAEDKTYNVMGNIVFLPSAPYTNGSIITREHNIEIHVDCAIASEHLAHAEFDPEVKTLIYYEAAFGHFNFSLKMYKGENFKKSFKSSDFPIDVDLNERLYFQARSWARSGTELLLDSCRATPTANPFDEVQYTFIKDGCIIDDTVEIHPTRFDLRKRFSISAFAFMGFLTRSSVFIHCDMRICDMTDPNSKCAHSCGSDAIRTRRDVISEGNSTAAYQDTDGPIRLVQLHEMEEARSIFHTTNADVTQTALLLVIILMLILLLAMGLRGICKGYGYQTKKADAV